MRLHLSEPAFGPPVARGQLVWTGLALLLAATALGAPVFVLLGGAALILFWGNSEPLAVLPIDQYGLVMNATLPTVPLFTLAGYFLAEGGASRRLVRVCDALVGHFRGGAAIGAALACAFFTSFTGASGVTILALGGLLMPVLIASRYSERSALGLLTGAGSLGLLFPPCLPLILYAIVANVRIQDLFLGGMIPGVTMVLLTAALGIWLGPKEKQGEFRWSEARAATWDAKWELLLPVVALVALFGGFATPLEAAALTAFYAFIVETFIHRDLKTFPGRAACHDRMFPARRGRAPDSWRRARLDRFSHWRRGAGQAARMGPCFHPQPSRLSAGAEPVPARSSAA